MARHGPAAARGLERDDADRSARPQHAVLGVVRYERRDRPRVRLAPRPRSGGPARPAPPGALALPSALLRLVLGPRWALFGTALVGTLPVLAVNGPSFMTDMP